MTDAEELIADANLFLADAVDLVSTDTMSRRQARRARTLSSVAATLYVAAAVRDQTADRFIAAESTKPDTETATFPGPSELWIARFLADHDCHLLTVQKANGAAGNPEAMVTCQTCDKRIPLP